MECGEGFVFHFLSLCDQSKSGPTCVRPSFGTKVKGRGRNLREKTINDRLYGPFMEINVKSQTNILTEHALKYFAFIKGLGEGSSFGRLRTRHLNKHLEENLCVNQGLNPILVSKFAF